MGLGSFENVIYNMCLQIIYIYMYKQDLPLNNLQELIRNQTKPNRYWALFIYIYIYIYIYILKKEENTLLYIQVQNI